MACRLSKSEKRSAFGALLLVIGSTTTMALQKPDFMHLKGRRQFADNNHAFVGFDASGNLKFDNKQSHGDLSVEALTCPAGTRGAGGVCTCNGAAGWTEKWQAPWCFEGKCYSGIAGDARCKGNPARTYKSLGDGTGCFGERRDTECSTNGNHEAKCAAGYKYCRADCCDVNHDCICDKICGGNDERWTREKSYRDDLGCSYNPLQASTYTLLGTGWCLDSRKSGTQAHMPTLFKKGAGLEEAKRVCNMFEACVAVDVGNNANGHVRFRSKSALEAALPVEGWGQWSGGCQNDCVPDTAGGASGQCYIKKATTRSEASNDCTKHTTDAACPLITCSWDGVRCQKPSAKCPDHCRHCDMFGKCSKCTEGKFVSRAGDCLLECPPGDYEKDGKCERCYGESRRRRAKTCEECQDGHVDEEGTDKCVNMQSYCTKDQCQTCADCLDEMTGPLHECWATREVGAVCINFDNSWCGKFYSKFMQCESFSMPCYFKLLCNSPCVCPEWKSVRCGGVTNPPGQKCTASMLEELVQLGQRQNTTKMPAMLATGESVQDKLHAREVVIGSAHERKMDDALQDKCGGV